MCILSLILGWFGFMVMVVVFVNCRLFISFLIVVGVVVVVIVRCIVFGRGKIYINLDNFLNVLWNDIFLKKIVVYMKIKFFLYDIFINCNV